jgi:hypothetical protein
MVSPGFGSGKSLATHGPHRWAMLGPMTGFSPVIQYGVELRSLN